MINAASDRSLGLDPGFVTREPIPIFSQVKNVKEEKKEKLNRLLEALRKKLPEGFKIGAAVGKGDCFFDSLAQDQSIPKKLVLTLAGFSCWKWLCCLNF